MPRPGTVLTGADPPARVARRHLGLADDRNTV